MHRECTPALVGFEPVGRKKIVLEMIMTGRTVEADEGKAAFEQKREPELGDA